MKIYGLIGRSLIHSFSEKYFSEKFRKENISDCEYRNFEIKNFEKEISFLKKTPQIKGLNVTIPYKRDVFSFLDEISSECKAINACNCIKPADGKWIGFNTDAVGFEKSFLPHLKPHQKKALILGTGGASNAVAFVLEKLNIDYIKVSRNTSGNSKVITYNDITPEIFKLYNIVINTTPAGTFPKADECPDLPYQLITGQYYFFDLVYNPSKTLFLSRAQQYGATICNGENMLSIQAEESWKIWNDLK
jgi:shikimate dehydrogenase